MQKYLLIPEPATYGLLGLGLLAVAVLRKFRHPQRV
ncbi:MAG: PEP-CTERM sorting domain-containing protein [Verrucomicrobiales bacterium]|nr:PEP-CTERM sorting domain-containing protein [Verrucomicrobiales bacterium]